MGERVKEHFKAPSPIHLHRTTTGHPMDPKHFSIVHKEVNNQSRPIKEAMFIKVQDPTLNRNLGKYQLPHIWDHLLIASPTLQCNLPVFQLPPPHLVYPLLVSSPPTTHTGGGIYFYGKYTCLAKLHPTHPETPQITKTTPSLHPHYSSAILVSFLYFIC